MQNRITKTFDSRFTIITKMSDENINAMAVINELLFEKIVPCKFLEDGLSTVLLMDAIGLYGEGIERFYNQVCGRDLILMRAVLMAVKYGWISSRLLVEVCSIADHPDADMIPVRAIYHKISDIGRDPNVSPQDQISIGLNYSR